MGERMLNIFLKSNKEDSSSASEFHPEIDQLVALHNRYLPQPDQNQIETHISQCPQCHDTLVDIAHFFDETPFHGSAADIIHTWEKFRQSAALSEARKQSIYFEEHTEGPFELYRKRSPRGYLPRQTFNKFVIGFAFIALTLAGWGSFQWWKTRRMEQAQVAAEDRASRLWEQMQTLELENQGLRQTKQEEIASLSARLDQLVGPRLNWPVFDVYPSGFLNRTQSQSDLNNIGISTDIEGFSLILIPENRTDFPDYRIEVIDTESRISWQGDGLQRNHLNAFNITFTRGALPKDRYILRVYGKSGTRLSLVGEFPIRIKEIKVTN